MSERNAAGKSLVLIVHALIWAAAMLGGTYLFKDRPWGEDLFLWMIVGFTLANGLLMSVLGRSRPRC